MLEHLDGVESAGGAPDGVVGVDGVAAEETVIGPEFYGVLVVFEDATQL